MKYQQSAPICAVTIEQLHHHLQIDFDFDDGLLESYALAATQHAEHIMQREIIKRGDPQALCESIDTVPPMVRQYVLLETADLYRYRETMQSGSLTPIFVHLLDPFILYDRHLKDEQEEANGSN